MFYFAVSTVCEIYGMEVSYKSSAQAVEVPYTNYD